MPAATNPPGDALPNPQAYATLALDFIEQTAYKVPAVDWTAIRAKATERIVRAQTIADTYPIIADTLKGLGDRHSSFTRPPEAVTQTAGRYNGFGFLAVAPSRVVITVVPNSPAALAGLRIGDRIDLVDGAAPTLANGTVTIKRDAAGRFPDSITLRVSRMAKTGKRQRLQSAIIVIKQGEVTLISVPTTIPVPLTVLGTKYGYIEVPGIVGDPSAQQVYASELQTAIRQTDAPTRCGWVVDLRRNRGGYIFAMLAGVGPIAGDGLLGGRRDARGTVTEWRYVDGALVENGTKTVVSADPYRLLHANPPVAVLTSAISASAAEATAIAFRGRPGARSFGEATNGIPTYNTRRTMPDGAFLDVMTNVDVDRNGTPYEGPVPVDEPVAIDWSNIANDRDPVLAAAVRWLSTQPACTTTP